MELKKSEKIISPESASRYQKTKQVSVLAAGLNFILGVIKLLAGIFWGSSALIADGVHSFSDIIADFFVIVTAKFSQHDADEDHPYGHRRIETLGAFGIGLFLVLIGGSLGYESVHWLWVYGWSGENPKPEIYTIAVAVLAILGNESLFFYTRYVGRKIGSSLLIANAYHSRADSLTCVIVLIGLIGAAVGYPFLDKIAAILVALYLIKVGYDWAIKALSELVDTGVSPQQFTAMQTLIHSTPGVMKSHQLRTRRMADQVLLDVHIEVNPYISVSEGHYIGETVRMRLGQAFPELFDITVHVDIDEHVEGIPRSMPPSPETLKAQLLRAWEGLVQETELLGIRVHYFSQKIEVEGLISAQLQERLSPELEKKLKQKADVISISLIRFWSLS